MIKPPSLILFPFFHLPLYRKEKGKTVGSLQFAVCSLQFAVCSLQKEKENKDKNKD